MRSDLRLVDLPGGARLAVAGFAVLFLAFSVVAQAQLWVHAGGGKLPTPQRVLERYHGRADSSHLHEALDPALPEDDPHAMYPFLGDDDATRRERRDVVLAWVESGAAESAFEPVRQILTDPLLCAQCHEDGGSAPFALATYEDVLPHARRVEGMPWPQLLTSAHNHLFAFAVAALALSLAMAFSRAPRSLRHLAIGAAFVAPLLDVGGWLLTRWQGGPWHWLVMAGGALFGVATTFMAAWVVLDVLRGPGRTQPGPAADA